MAKNSERVFVRFTPEDKEVMDIISAKEGICISTWIRKLAIKYLTDIGKRKKPKREVGEYSR